MSVGVDSYIEEKTAAPTLSREEGAGVQKAKGRTIQPIQALGPSGKGMEGQSRWPASTTGQTTSDDRSDRLELPVRPVEPSI